jgi:hypothetical protein
MHEKMSGDAIQKALSQLLLLIWRGLPCTIDTNKHSKNDAEER